MVFSPYAFAYLETLILHCYKNSMMSNAWNNGPVKWKKNTHEIATLKARREEDFHQDEQT